MREQLRTVREQVFASCPRTTRVGESIREQFTNKPSLLFLGIFTKLAYFGGNFETYPEFQRIFREKFVKSSLNAYNILGE